MTLPIILRAPEAELTRTGDSPTYATVKEALKDLYIDARLEGAMTEGAEEDVSRTAQPIPQSESESEWGLQQQSFSWVGGQRTLAAAETWVPTKLRHTRLARRTRRFIPPPVAVSEILLCKSPSAHP